MSAPCVASLTAMASHARSAACVAMRVSISAALASVRRQSMQFISATYCCAHMIPPGVVDERPRSLTFLTRSSNDSEDGCGCCSVGTVSFFAKLQYRQQTTVIPRLASDIMPITMYTKYA